MKSSCFLLLLLCCRFQTSLIPLLILISSSISRHYTLFPPFISIDIFPFCVVDFTLRTPGEVDPQMIHKLKEPLVVRLNLPRPVIVTFISNIAV